MVAPKPNNIVVSRELSLQSFDHGNIEPNHYNVKFDPAGAVTVTYSPDGIKLAIPITTTNLAEWTKIDGITSTVDGVVANITIPIGKIEEILGYAGGKPVYQKVGDVLAANTTHTLSFDSIGNTVTSIVNGITQTIDLGVLDDEGAKLVINGQNLELQAEDGTVLSSTPISQIDAQQLSAAMNGLAWEVTLSNGGTVSLTCAEVGAMFRSGKSPIDLGTEFLASDCQKYTLKAIAAEVNAQNPPQTIATIQGNVIQGAQIALSNGGVAVLDPINCKDISNLYDQGKAPIDLSASFLADNCQKYTFKDVVNDISTYLPNQYLTPIQTDILAGGAFELSNGGGQITFKPITCKDISNLYTPAKPPLNTSVSFLADDCNRYSFKTIVSELTNYFPNQGLGLVQADLFAGGSFTLSGGGGQITFNPITCKDIGNLYPAGTPTPKTLLLSKNCMSFSIGEMPIAPSQLTPGALPVGVTVPAVSIAGVIAPANLPPTNHVNTWTQTGGLAQSVNGVVANTTIPSGTIANYIGYNAAGNPVYAPLTTPPTSHFSSIAIAPNPTPGLRTTVNGVTSTIPIVPTNVAVVDEDVQAFAVWDKTGNFDTLPLSKTPRAYQRILPATAANTNTPLTFPAANTQPLSVSSGTALALPATSPLYDVYGFSTVILIGGPGNFVTLHDIPAALRPEFSGMVWTIIATPGWAGAITVNAPAGANVDGKATITLQKPVAADRVAWSFRYAGAGTGPTNSFWFFAKTTVANDTIY